nr:DNA-directed RNA polymerases I and III subunit rpac1 isoform X1 [Ipomoea batatas]
MSSTSTDSESETEPMTVEKVPVWDLPDVPQGELPSHIENLRTRVLCTYIAPTNTDKIKYSGAFASMGVDNSLRSEQFRKNFRVEVMKLNEDDIEFDMIGIDAAVANAFRRILIAELPTMAIEKVLIANNTSIIQDEVLAHRLGLIPLKVDPRLFEYMSENDVPNEKNTIVFSLHARCEKAKKERISVKSSELKWLPNGSEFVLATENSASSSASKPKTYTSFSCSQDSLPEFSNNPIAPKYPDITIARLGAGQEIELEAHAVKGIGKTHAKWSPVATAWYRMLPEVVLLREIEGDEAEQLVEKCPVKVFDIEDIGKGTHIEVVACPPRGCYGFGERSDRVKCLDDVDNLM